MGAILRSMIGNELRKGTHLAKIERTVTNYAITLGKMQKNESLHIYTNCS